MIHYMKQIKKVFDPYGIMNPYKVLPDIDPLNWKLLIIKLLIIIFL